jgi:selenocysteine lyase/cysteine desulfurase
VRVLTNRFARLRTGEFPQLDHEGCAYLDNTGGGLPPRSLVEAHCRDVLTGVWGNPHSESAPSLRTTESVQRARQAVLEFFGADPDQYTVLFTANATAAVRCVGEAFPFRPGTGVMLTRDNHNSVNGLRTFARTGGGEVVYLPPTAEDRPKGPLSIPNASGGGLFAYPAQSNFSGTRYPLEWVEQAQSAGWRVLLDAAAFVPTHRLSLSETPADFVCVSFYKMFGYPTGVGALIARLDALSELRRPWFSGGTVEWVTVQPEDHRSMLGAPSFEDGSPNYLSMGAVTAGLGFLSEIGMDRISDHIAGLTERLVCGLRSRCQGGGRPKVRIYGHGMGMPSGGTVAFNLLEPDGAVASYAEVETRARDEGIAIRGGCFCNPGASELAFATDPTRTHRCLEQIEPGRFTPKRLGECLETPEVGAVRASLGISSNASDVDRLLAFVDAY